MIYVSCLSSGTDRYTLGKYYVKGGKNMKKPMKYLLLALILGLAVLALGGCKKKRVRDPNTILIGVPENANVTDYKTNEWTKWLEQETGFKLEFEKFAARAEDYRSQLATRIANYKNEELPDLLWGFSLSDTLIKDYGDGGYFIDLKPYYDDKEGASKIFWDQLSIMDEDFQNEVVRKLTDPDNGKMYAAARIEYALFDPMHYQVYINKPWLDKLGLEMPTNLDELYDVLVAFRDRDPNGNGEKDEIPLVGTINTYGDVVDWLLNFFIYQDDTKWWNADDDQKLFSPFMTEEYREGLKFVNKLYKEGLLHQSVFSNVNKDLKALMNPEGDNPEIVGIISGHSSLLYIEGSDSMYDYEALPLIGCAVHSSQAFNKRLYITSDCQYPDNVWKLIMAMNSDEGSKRGYYGVKGRDWDDADPGAKSVLGLDADVKIYNYIWGNIQNNECWAQVNTILLFAENEKTQIAGDEDAWSNVRIKKMAEYYHAFEAAAEKNNPKYIVHTLIYSTEEREATATIRSNVEDCIKTMRTAFTTGDGKDINNDADWNAYIKELEDLGIETWREQAQKLYDEQQKK